MARPYALSIVIVHYRTPELVGPCVEALRRDLEAAGLEAELWLVDNSGTEQHRRSFEELGLQVIDPGSNVGYAGGVNRGIAAASADRLVVMNPDVWVRPGCLPALLGALEAGYQAAGPRFYWDTGGRLLLPPNEPRQRLWELRASRAASSAFWARRARTAWRRHSRRHWAADGALSAFELSGALLALRRDAWQRVGAFDEGYTLYFEETDWLHRLRRAGGRAAYQGAAEAVHLYDQSARREPRAAGWFAQSRRRFQERHYGRWFANFLEAVERRGSLENDSEPVHSIGLATAPPRLALPEGGPVWVEVSPRSLGFPAAAERVAGAGDWELPPEVWERLSPGTYWLRVVDEDGRELVTEAFTKA